VEFLEGRKSDYAVTALQRDLASISRKLEKLRADDSVPEKRLADNMMDFNPAATAALLQLMWGALPPGREGSLMNARLRYFDPERRRAGVPEDVGALVSEMSDTATVVTLVNLSATAERSVIVQGGAYGEHRIETVEQGGATTRVGAEFFTVRLAPGAGAKLTLTMKRYAAIPTVAPPWARN
jgi:hypothetical protein